MALRAPLTEPPLPPRELRRLVCHDDRLFDLAPDRDAVDDLSPSLFESVVDFGCGCGRIARQLMVQPNVPERYLGLDVNRSMVQWCQENLAPLHSDWHFRHHNVYNKNLGPDNSRQRMASFELSDAEASLVLAHSVFTHLSLDQTIFYLHEMRRVLRPGGVAKTTWFLFARDRFPMLIPDQVCLFVNEDDPTNAVIYDWQWLRQAFVDAGFRIRRIAPPGLPGHQWEIQIEARKDDLPDVLPNLEDLRANLCAAPASMESLRELPHAPPGREAAAPSPVDVVADPEPTHSPATRYEPGRKDAPPVEEVQRPEAGRLSYTGTLTADEFDARCAQDDFWYHSYYFDNGFEIRGDYDIGADVEDYGFPEDLTGWRVLDIGSGAGWFSHYFEQCGADVTAVDARGYEEFDVYGRPNYPPVERPRDRTDGQGRPVHHSPVNKSFWTMKEILGSSIRFLNGRVYDVPNLVGQERFDLVFLGALLCHLRDPIGALMAARQVCKGMVIASTPVVIGEPIAETEPRQYLPYTTNDKISWWLPNEACFQHWFLAAGFRDADPGPEVLLRGDKPRLSPDGELYNGDQQIRVGRAFV